MAKNLANCNLKEFVTQTAKIKRQVEKWLTETDIMNIRKHLPELPDDMSKEERVEALKAQGLKNASEIFDAVFEEHPDDTIELIALLCFVPADEIETHPMTYYMGSITEMLDNEDVWNFFISLAVAARKLGITQG